MIVRLMGIRGYHYTKDGIEKQGRSLMVCSSDAFDNDDGNGNFTYGNTVEAVFIPRSIKNPTEYFVEMIGKDVELVYDRELGSRTERLVAVVLAVR